MTNLRSETFLFADGTALYALRDLRTGAIVQRFVIPPGAGFSWTPGPGDTLEVGQFRTMKIRYSTWAKRYGPKIARAPP